jgi:copper(I)-binding protein
VAVNRSTSRPALAGLVMVGAVALAGCGAGQYAQTAEQKPTVDGQAAQVGPIAIRNAALEYPAGGAYQRGSDARLRMVVVNGGIAADALTSVSSPVATGVTISEGGPAEATGTSTPEPTGTGSPTASPGATATGTATGTPTGTAAGTAAPTPTAGGSPPATGSPAATPTTAGSPENAQIQIPPNNLVSFTEDGPRVMLTGLTRQLRPGQNLTVTLTFKTAGSVTMTIAVGTPETELPPAPTVSVDPDSESEG